MQHSPEATHLLYILLDSNLPTGGFVASSGLEAYAKHGFLRPPATTATTATNAAALVHFVRESVKNYSASCSPFVRGAWEVISQRDWETVDGEDAAVEHMVQQILHLDALYEALTLNHVTRRSSTAQGIALLTLYAKAFAPAADDETSTTRSAALGSVVIDRIKKSIRRGETAGHLPVCWGLITAAAGLSLEQTTHLHLFLHIRAVLSAAVRLNIVGPYASTGLLVRDLRGVLEGEVWRAAGGQEHGGGRKEEAGEDGEVEENEWAWAEEAEHQALYQQANDQPPTSIHHHHHPCTNAHAHQRTGPAAANKTQQRNTPPSGGGATMTWPLGELLMARHDFQHTRIFNS